MSEPAADVSRIALRPLAESDYQKGYLSLLGQLTVANDVPFEAFQDVYKNMQQRAPDYYTVVAEDTHQGKIVGTATIMIERKFIRNCGKVGHVEDVVVDSGCRGMQLGKRLVEAVTAYSKEQGCYKIILDCTEENVSFYEKCGYTRKDVQMAKYFI